MPTRTIVAVQTLGPVLILIGGYQILRHSPNGLSQPPGRSNPPARITSHSEFCPDFTVFCACSRAQDWYRKPSTGFVKDSEKQALAAVFLRQPRA